MVSNTSASIPIIPHSDTDSFYRQVKAAKAAKEASSEQESPRELLNPDPQERDSR